MLRVGIFGTNGELSIQVTRLLIDELLEQCRETMNSEVGAVASHASGYGIGEFVFEEGCRQGLETVGVVLPSCRESEWSPVDDLVYIGDEWGEEGVTDCSRVVDVIVWVGKVEPREDWEKFSNASGVKMLSVSDSMADWASPQSVIELESMFERVPREPPNRKY